MSNEVRQRRYQANYLNTAGKGADAPAYALLGAGTKSLNETPSAQMKSKRYVCDKSSSSSVVGYNWTTPFELDQIRAQAAINFIVNIGENQLVGADAETDYVIVDVDQEEGDDTYHARKFNVAVEVASFNDDDGEMTATGNFHAIGDMVIGTFNTKTNTFTPAGETVTEG